MIAIFLIYGFFRFINLPVNAAKDACWIKTYTNGIGIVPSACGDSDEKNGALCYPKCKDGYSGAGPVCWSNCPSGYSDTGAFCQLWPHIYGKGCCCTIFTKSCCGNCQSGYSDDGCTCRKNGNTIAKSSYGRGAGVPPICSKHMLNDAGLCYKPCNNEYYNIGPICYKHCSGEFNFKCGTVCVRQESECLTNILIQAMSFGTLAANVCE